MERKMKPVAAHPYATDYHFATDALPDRVTATETIDGVQHLLVLQQDDTGCYREVVLEPLGSCGPRSLTEMRV